MKSQAIGLSRPRRSFTALRKRVGRWDIWQVRGNPDDRHTGEVCTAWHAKETVRASTTSTAQPWLSDTPSNSRTISKTSPAHPR